jgi:hypothetical protein
MHIAIVPFRELKVGEDVSDWLAQGGTKEQLLERAKAAPRFDAQQALDAFIGTALRRNVDENDIVSACIDDGYAGNVIYEPVKDNGGEAYVKRQIERALNDAGNGRPTQSSAHKSCRRPVRSNLA